jgi:hypothetical protein
MGLMMIKCRKGTIINDDDDVMVASILMMNLMSTIMVYGCIECIGNDNVIK